MYTFRTKQHGITGATAEVYDKDGVFVWESPLMQTFHPEDTDRKLAARAAHEHIADLEQMNS